MEYDFHYIEQKWQQAWKERHTYKVENGGPKPKCYVLDMFPYPSGAGLHVGHPLGYIASDIVARYKRLAGYNVLHPMGYDAFGLPAEQYAIQTGQHPAKTTEDNIKRYREQMDRIGFSFDWSREVRTSDPGYYKWTQWIFLKLFGSWYNNEKNKAEPVETLIAVFEKEGFRGEEHRVLTGDIEHDVQPFTAEQWKNFTEKEKSDVLMNFRLAYLGEAWVNWCPALGTVLANDEVKDGVSERGGYPVERKRMPQWSMRITSYADRLLNDLDALDWTESMKEAQRNWIGRSEGTSLKFRVPRPGAGQEQADLEIEVFTTRPDTVFGVTFVTLAPEHELIAQITTAEQKKEVDEYVTMAKNRSERERQADVKKVTGAFTGAYAIHPFTNEKIPVWTGDYVLAGYGTGAVMGVPAHDSRDFAFAKHFGLPIKQVIEVSTAGLNKHSSAGSNEHNSASSNEHNSASSNEHNSASSNEHNSASSNEHNSASSNEHTSDSSDKHNSDSSDKHLSVSSSASREQTESYDAKEGKCINSGFLNGLDVKDAVKRAIAEIEKRGLGKGKVNYRLRDAAFGRQRYWGEPIPVYYKDGIPHPLPENELPLVLPEIDKFQPTETGEPPLGRAKDWKYKGQYEYELTTMPGWAGSSWYYLRYMDPHNADEFVSKEAVDYWKNVDLYIGGAEHATGHLLYVRFWTKFLFDTGKIPVQEPAQKLVNQGMIQGVSAFVYRLNLRIIDQPTDTQINLPPVFVSCNKYKILCDRTHPEYSNAYSEIETVLNQISNELQRQGKLWSLDLSERIFLPPLNVPIDFVENDILNIQLFHKWRPESQNAKFILENGEYICGREVEKMSKSKYNVVTPDDICNDYGADTLRLYEMFLGPLEQSKPWNTNGITGVHGFLKRFWRLFENPGTEKANDAELKILNRTLKKVKDDIERMSFNTCVSQFMIAVNELTDLKCSKRAILEPLVIALSPFAPHIAEELWEKLGHSESVTKAEFPAIDEKYLVDDTFDYPVQVNGKVRFTFTASLQKQPKEIESEVLSTDEAKKWLEGKTPKKVIVVPKRIVNIVV
ncbi:MAG TPA: class I tRNA ligase family protein [Bacteroidia bacterium]|nr:class I tRNA ligase family protein [Bacteroidia bacterium]